MSTMLERYTKALELASEQAEDDALWSIPQTATEEYLQQALREMHGAVEGEHMEWYRLAKERKGACK